ncbi:HNH endonuclease [Stenotrophomonas phage Silvanus]|nr:HNH endonuclease [Stenotrophomonas phage Silvanus]
MVLASLGGGGWYGFYSTRGFTEVNMKLQKIPNKFRTPQRQGFTAPGRKTANERGYNYRWQQERIAFLKDNPFCVHCLPMFVASTVVDHITPHRGDQVLFWDRSNWQALCKRCHDEWKQKLEISQARGERATW